MTPRRLTTEHTRCDDLGAGMRFLDTERTERMIASVTMGDDDIVVITSTTGTVHRYPRWYQAPVYALNGRRIDYSA